MGEGRSQRVREGGKEGGVETEHIETATAKPRIRRDEGRGGRVRGRILMRWREGVGEGGAGQPGEGGGVQGGCC